MVEVLGIRLIGVSWENGRKLLLTATFIGLVLCVRSGAVWLLRKAMSRTPNERLVFGLRQGLGLLTAVLIGFAVMSIWFDDPARLALPAGIVTAGVAFALQRVITSVAGYIFILRGKTFTVGDRIIFGGVRGDVIALGFIHTTILEMGEPTEGGNEGPAVWVHARQYTGRVVTVTNDKIFDKPIYNYSSEFPFIWEEMRVPVRYGCDRARAEMILLDAAREETRDIKQISEEHRERLRREYFVDVDRDEARVYWRITDNWLELAVRFVCRPHEARVTKDRIARRILAAFDAAGIAIASSTHDVVGFPPVRVELLPSACPKGG
jgi:small-conductance mechanosensitive channel